MSKKPVYASAARLKNKKSEKLLQGSLHTSGKNKSNKSASAEIADKSKEGFIRGDVKIACVGEKTVVTKLYPELKKLPERTSRLTHKAVYVENPITRTVHRKFPEYCQQSFSTNILTNKKEVKKVDFGEISNQSSTLALMQSISLVNKNAGQPNTTSKRFVKSRYLQTTDANTNNFGNKTTSNIPTTSRKSKLLKRDATITQNCTLNHKAPSSPKTSRPPNQKTSTPVTVNKSIFKPDVSVVLAPHHSGMETRKMWKEKQQQQQQVKLPLDGKISQTTLFIAYSQYLTNCVMSKKGIEDANEKNAKVLQELTNLTTDNVHLEQEVTDLEIEVRKMEGRENVEASLKLQHSVLEPVVDGLEHTTVNFNNLVANVDDVRHTLTLKKIAEIDAKKLGHIIVDMETSLEGMIPFLHTLNSAENKLVKVIKDVSEKTEEEFKVLKNLEEKKQKLLSAKSKNNRLEYQLEIEQKYKK